MRRSLVMLALAATAVLSTSPPASADPPVTGAPDPLGVFDEYKGPPLCC